MIELTLSLETKSEHQLAKRIRPVNQNKIKGDELEYFPLPRYFQTHFQYIHENTHSAQRELKQLQQYLATIEAKLETLLTMHEKN